MSHEFIFEPGIWIGEGKITFSASQEHVRYFTKWNVHQLKDKKIICQQDVQMQGSDETVSNHFIFDDVTPATFLVELSNELLGTVRGKGVIDAKTLAWEFRGHTSFEGFEVYELQDNGDYMVHAEYVSPDQFRTIIDGRIWKKST